VVVAHILTRNLDDDFVLTESYRKVKYGNFVLLCDNDPVSEHNQVDNRFQELNVANYLLFAIVPNAKF